MDTYKYEYVYNHKTLTINNSPLNKITFDTIDTDTNMLMNVRIP